jgi:hypothetical protein
MWTKEDPGRFAGHLVNAPEPLCSPISVHPGGRIEHKLRVLDGHCERTGRAPESVRRIVNLGLDPADGGLDQLRTLLDELAALGIDQVNLSLPAGCYLTSVARLATLTRG